LSRWKLNGGGAFSGPAIIERKWDMESTIITKRKDARGRRVIGYRAQIGHVEADGATPAEARAAVEAAVLKMLANVEQGVTCIPVPGDRTMLVLADRFTPGWCYRFTDQVSGQGPFPGREVAEDRGFAHAAQNAW